jgi:hypothetical protein
MLRYAWGYGPSGHGGAIKAQGRVPVPVTPRSPGGFRPQVHIVIRKFLIYNAAKNLGSFFQGRAPGSLTPGVLPRKFL